MSELTDERFVDHPAPSIGLVTLLTVCTMAIVVALPPLFVTPAEEVPPFFVPAITAIIVLSLGVMCFYFWPIYSTYYTLDRKGVEVKYGPWVRTFTWSEFETAYWQRGMFVTKIGWPSVTPCVRLSNGIVLKRKHKTFGLYLTPNDPEAFIRKIELFAPELTKSMIK